MVTSSIIVYILLFSIYLTQVAFDKFFWLFLLLLSRSHANFSIDRIAFCKRDADICQNYAWRTQLNIDALITLKLNLEAAF